MRKYIDAMKSSSQAHAYPGLPIVFAEGFRDYGNRISGHSSVSLAITDIHDMVKTVTDVEVTNIGLDFRLKGSVEGDARSGGVYRVMEKMVGMATERVGLRVKSENHGILTGSSDSGAAALVTAIDDALELGLSREMMCDIGRDVSETCYRSIFGGLSEFLINEAGDVSVGPLRKASFFKDLVIYAVNFEGKRFGADDLHKRVSQHPRYCQRALQAKIRIDTLRNIVDDGDLSGFMSLMETEAKTVHQMFSDMGMDVIRPDMKSLCDMIVNIRGRGIEAYWNVAGGTSVYVFTLKKHAKEMTRNLKDQGYKYRHFKVAESAKTGL